MAEHELPVQGLEVAISGKAGVIRKGQHGAGTIFEMRRIDAGKLLLPTGRICITDVYSADEFPPLNRIVPDGEYPVELVIAQIPDSLPFGGDRCAFAMVTFAEDPVTSWEPVTAVKASQPNFMDKKPNCFIQNGGTGLFSPEAGAVHFAHLAQQYDAQVEAIRKQSKSFGINDWVNYRPGQGRENLIMVGGGMGDGQYTCHVGLTNAGRVSRLVIDFDIAAPVTAK